MGGNKQALAAIKNLAGQTLEDESLSQINENALGALGLMASGFGQLTGNL